MKILIYSDNHWCKYSSIVRSRGQKYSTRLENQIDSINWAEEVATNFECDYVFMLGDFFDSQQLDSEELTALKDIHWSNKEHFILCGNHELGLNNLAFSSAHLFELKNALHTIDKPESMIFNNVEICFLPYILESVREPINKYFGEKKLPRIIVSHNDLKGVQMGAFLSQTGFEISDIQANCDLFINGHLHNGAKVADKVINIGNLTGQNFGEDAFRYTHEIFILDTETMKIDVYENPYAFNFYKLDSTNYLLPLKNNAVVTVKCTIDKLEEMKERFKGAVASRFIIEQTESDEAEEFKQEELAVDHLQKFKEFILETMGTGEEVLQELSEVTKCE